MRVYKNNALLPFIILLFTIELFASCVDFSIKNNDDSLLEFSSDTISFDTVFTTIGSTTMEFRIINSGSSDITINKLYIAGSDSYFKMNLDGESGNSFDDVAIRKEDSLYVFIEVEIDPTDSDNPVLIEDSIVFEMDDGTQYVNLEAYGQDVNILQNDTLETVTWSGKPYLLLGDVWIKEGHTLTIDAGIKVYCHNAADTVNIYVLGNIIVNGTVDEPVVFRGDRLDEIWDGYKYDYNSGIWGGIYIEPSSEKSVFSNCIIRSAISGLYIGDFYSEIRPKVDLHNVVIHNNSIYGLFAINTELTMLNCQVTNSGYYNFIVSCGGKINVYNSTIANYYGLDYNATRDDDGVCLAITNAIAISDDYYSVNDLDEANFVNCIVDGDYDTEIAFQYISSYDFNFSFDHCILKIGESVIDTFPDCFSSCYFNEEPGFRKVERWNYDFQLDTSSCAIDRGTNAVVSEYSELEFDLNGNSRLLDDASDLGAYEYFETEE